MKKSKVFLLLAVVFMAIIFYVVYDMSSKTTFPGGKKPNNQTKSAIDSINRDTFKIEVRRNEPDRKKD